MRIFALALLACLPLSAQFRVENLSNQDLDEMQLWEQYRDVTKQVRDMCVAGETSGGPFDVASEVAKTFSDQLKNDYPTLAKLILAADNTAPARANLTCDKIRIMWDGWDWNEPDANPLGATITACASLCDYTTLQAAVNAMAFGDKVVLKKGETYGSSSTATVLDFPDQQDFGGTCPYYSVIEVEDYATNFTPGIAATEADTANMAKLVGGDDDAGSYFNPVIELASLGTATVNGGNTTTDVLQTSTAHGFIVGDKLVWVRIELSPYSWWGKQTGELTETKPWYVVAVPTTTTLQVSDTPGGTAYDLTVLPTTYGSYGLRKFNRPVSCVKIRGLEVEIAAGDTANQEMIRLSSVEPIMETTPSHILFRHLYVHGQPAAVGVAGPQVGMRIDGRNISIRDTTVKDILGTANGGGNEGKAIGLYMAYGPVWMENVRLSGAMSSVGVGFVAQYVQYAQPGSNGGFVNKNLYVWKDPSWYVQYRAAANPTPTDYCLPGTIWKNNTGPVCTICGGGGTWGSTPEADCNAYDNLTIKNLWEIKHCAACLLWNLWGELSPYGDAAQEYWLTIKATNDTSTLLKEEWHNSALIGYNFRSRWTHSGPLLRGSVANNSMKGVVLGPQALWQGLSTEVDSTKFAYETGSSGSKSASMGTLDTWQQIRHVTQTGFADTSGLRLLITTPAESGRPQYGLSFRDNIFQIASLNATGLGYANCTILTAGVTAGSTPEWENNLTFGYTAPSFSGCSTNYWNETAGANVGFADYANGDMEITSAGTTGDYRAGAGRGASDGKALGVDFEVLDDGMGGRDGAVVKAGIGGWSDQFGVKIPDATATTATVEWDRPNAANACNFYLYTDYARTAEHADTSGANADSRTGSDVTAGHVTFNLGTNSVLTTKTQYWFEIDCPTDSVKMVGALFTN